MSKEFRDLMAGGEDADIVALETEVVTHGGVTPHVLSNRVLVADRWCRRQAERLQGEYLEMKSEHDIAHVSDSLVALFEFGPEAEEHPADKRRAAWFAELLSTPEFKALRNRTCGDLVLSGLAAKAICDQWVAYAAKERPEHEGPEGFPGGPGESTEDAIDRIRSVNKATDDAEKAADDADGLMAGLGIGQGGKTDGERLLKVFRAVRNSTLLTDIMREAGRYVARCDGLQRVKTVFGRGELTGIEQSGDLARLLPWELAQVAGAIPELEALALYRLATRRSLSYRRGMKLPAESGPIVVCVDESGSMGGDHIIQAKALALAMVWLARKQKRWVCLAGFSAGTQASWHVCRPNDHDDEGLLKWLEHFYNGGTTLEVPCISVPEAWTRLQAEGMPRGRTDQIIITDGEVSELRADNMAGTYRAWAKQESVTTYGILLGRRDPGQMTLVCDKCRCLPRLSVDAAAVEEVLSI